ncbi:MAG: hypothetical protein H6735_32535 [Alphaproteobacteria bacterium]|nr:hypothetical protein [Alphaproteobacteria bacterium]
MLALSLTACLADIRPDAISIDEVQQERAERGRAMLRSAADASGYDAWLRADRSELAFADTWYGVGRAFNPWPSAHVTADIVQLPGTFDSEVRFTSGAKDGWTWGIEDGHAYVVDPEGGRSETDDAQLRFMLPTTQYFVDMPFRILEAPIVRYVGEETHLGVDYDVVYVTWKSVEANPEFDQYLMYVDQGTGRLGKVQYTVRESARFVSATGHFDDVEQADGIWVPRTMTINTSPDADPATDRLHVMVVDEISFHDDDGLARDAVPL